MRFLTDFSETRTSLSSALDTLTSGCWAASARCWSEQWVTWNLRLEFKSIRLGRELSHRIPTGAAPHEHWWNWAEELEQLKHLTLTHKPSRTGSKSVSCRTRLYFLSCCYRDVTTRELFLRTGAWRRRKKNKTTTTGAAEDRRWDTRRKRMENWKIEVKIKRKQRLQRPCSSSLIPNTSVTVQTTKNTDKEKEILKAKPHCSLSSNRPRSHIQPTDPKHQLIPLHTFTEKTLYRIYTLCTALGPNSSVSATSFATHIPLVSSFHAKCNYNLCHI